MAGDHEARCLNGIAAEAFLILLESGGRFSVGDKGVRLETEIGGRPWSAFGFTPACKDGDWTDAVWYIIKAYRAEVAKRTEASNVQAAGPNGVPG
jgi:hypothetical protein